MPVDKKSTYQSDFKDIKVVLKYDNNLCSVKSR